MLLVDISDIKTYNRGDDIRMEARDQITRRIKMKRRSLLAMVLALTMCVTMLAACSGDGGSDSDDPVTIDHQVVKLTRFFVVPRHVPNDT